MCREGMGCRAHVDRLFKHIRPHTVDGWDVYSERVQLNGQSIVAGYPTPDDTDVPANTACPLDNCTITGDFDVAIIDENPAPQGSDFSTLLASGLSVVEDCVRTYDYGMDIESLS